MVSKLADNMNHHQRVGHDAYENLIVISLLPIDGWLLGGFPNIIRRIRLNPLDPHLTIRYKTMMLFDNIVYLPYYQAFDARSALFLA